MQRDGYFLAVLLFPFGARLHNKNYADSYDGNYRTYYLYVKRRVFRFPFLRFSTLMKRVLLSFVVLVRRQLP